MQPLTANYPLLSHNTFGIAAQAAYFAEYDSPISLIQILDSPQVEGLPILPIGGGSNLLFMNDYQGLVLHSAIKRIDIIEQNDQSALVRAGSAIVWDDLVRWVIEHNLYGLENLSHIPGEVGASIVQNVGAYGVEVKDRMVCADVFDIESRKVIRVTHSDCCFGYRMSRFKQDWKGRYIVLDVYYRLSTCFSPDLSYGNLASLHGLGESLTAMDLRNYIIAQRDSKLPDPKVLGNGGSFFMNPILSADRFRRLQAHYPQVPHYPLENGEVKVPAGWLIEQAGWKGRSLNRVAVYEKQALVLVNLGGATGLDIQLLAQAIIADVQSQFGITIHSEVNWIES